MMRSNVRIGLLKEVAPAERRVALTPEVITRLMVNGHEVTVEKGAGTEAGLPDGAYAAVGADLGTWEQVWESAAVVGVNRPTNLPDNSQAVVIGFLRPLEDPQGIAALAAAGVTALAFELVPRITRAQSMDALSSQATVAGYQAALEAAMFSRRLFPMLTTAAGTIPPARTLVLGAGVAGLQAIATCRRLGAVVAGFDVRAAAAEQIRSLGATFVEVGVAPQDATQTGGYARQLDTSAESLVLDGLAPFIARSDVVICTAAIPGAAAPRLITAEMVKAMTPGSVIVDLAATTGGNCELTVPGKVIEHNGVTIVGYTDLPSRKAYDASQMYARNVAALVGLLGSNGEVNLDDEILAGCCVAHGGSVRVRN
jgi:NAD(P) transhydrogenase subunit alpha